MKNADRAVPPIPAPKTPVAKPRRSAWNHALTKGIPTANVVPAIPRKKPKRSIRGKERALPATATSRTNGMLASVSIGNMMRPPNRSVRAPTGMRPTEPTSTGVATRRAFWLLLRPICAV